MRWGVSRDATLLIAGQAIRASGYGFTAVALGATLPSATARGADPGVHAWLFVVLVPVGVIGLLLAWRLSSAVETATPSGTGAPSGRVRLGPSRAVVRRLACLFAVDAGGGG